MHPSKTTHAAVQQTAQRPTELLSALMRAKAKTPESGLLASYKVRSGDSLSGIAQHFYHSSSVWPVIFWANHGQIRWANEISTGQNAAHPGQAHHDPGCAEAARAGRGSGGRAHARYGGAVRPGRVCPRESAPAESAPAQYAPAQSAPAQSAPAQAVPAANYSGSSGLQQCIISRESGGNSQVMNGSGHYGLYQFSASTWQEYGGSAGSLRQRQRRRAESGVQQRHRGRWRVQLDALRRLLTGTSTW